MVICHNNGLKPYTEKIPQELPSKLLVADGSWTCGFNQRFYGYRQFKSSNQAIRVGKIKAKYKKNGIEIACAKDGFVGFLEQRNSVSELTVQQIGDIFSVKITNWKQVGGADAKIQLYGRESSSGTFEFFKEHVVKGDFSPACQTLPGTAAIVNAVKKDKYSIGYGGAAYAEGVKDCKVKKDAKSKGVLPTEANIKNKTYPISRYLYMYLKSKPTGETKAFIDWILSPEGQKMIATVGYFPVK